VALLATGMWQIQPDVTNARLGDGGADPKPPDRHEFWNPLWLTYRTADGRVRGVHDAGAGPALA
jgi:hypothetical protein